jgi:holin-like protein
MTGAISMINALAVFLFFQLVGEVISQMFKLPVPGPVVGMALLFLLLLFPSNLSERLRETAQRILQHLSLLFVPAGVGVMLHARRISDEWLAISVALIVSTVLTVAATALTISVLARFMNKRDTGDAGG